MMTKSQQRHLLLVVTIGIGLIVDPVVGQCGSVPPYMQDYCPITIEPVMCSGGSVGCVYRNECYAFAAGANLNTCSEIALTPSRRCPNVPSTSCPFIYEPVWCLIYGTEYCEYENQCTADAAFRNSGINGQCFGNDWDTCPAIPSNSCSKEYDPVSCTVSGVTEDCVYSNQCIANAACRGKTCVCQPTGSCPNANCNPSSNQVPYMCGDGQRDMPRDPAACWYASESCFESAGYSIDNCCKQPKVSDLSKCGSSYSPVVCGNKDCIYDNKCLAESAGFNYNNQCGKCNPNCLDTCTSPNSKNVGQGQRPRTCKGSTTQSSNPTLSSTADGNSTDANGTEVGASQSATSEAASGLGSINAKACMTVVMLLVALAL